MNFYRQCLVHFFKILNLLCLSAMNGFAFVGILFMWLAYTDIEEFRRLSMTANLEFLSSMVRSIFIFSFFLGSIYCYRREINLALGNLAIWVKVRNNRALKSE